MLTTLFRIVKYGILGFWRNGWVSLATISIMVVAAIVFEGLLLFNVLTKMAIATVQDKIDISVYFKQDAPEDDILALQRALQGLAEVKAVEYTSKDQALQAFKEKHADDPAIVQSLDELQSNPFVASLNVKAVNPKDYSNIASYLDNSSYKNKFEKITYAQNAVVIERLNKIIDVAREGGAVIIVFLAFVAALVTFNTIRLAIYADREEIGIMRLVGASNAFIRGPYMVQGVVYGFIAGIASLLVALPVVFYAAPPIRVFITGADIWGYFISHFPLFLLTQLGFGIVLGAISSWIAVRRYLQI